MKNMSFTEREVEVITVAQGVLLLEAALEEGVLTEEATWRDALSLDMSDKGYLRKLFLEDIEGYLGKIQAKKLFPDTLDEAAAEQVEVEVKTFLERYREVYVGSYWIFQYTKDGALFMDDDYVFEVHPLSKSFPPMLGDLPVFVEAALLPYEDKIIYDGYMPTMPFRIGGNLKSSITQNAEQRMMESGIIRQLPISANEVDVPSPKETLEFYMKNAKRREAYGENIEELVRQHPELKPLYCKLWGKVYARQKKKFLKAQGFKGYHFAVYDYVIIASAKTKKLLRERVEELLGEEQGWDSVYVFGV